MYGLIKRASATAKRQTFVDGLSDIEHTVDCEVPFSTSKYTVEPIAKCSSEGTVLKNPCLPLGMTYGRPV